MADNNNKKPLPLGPSSPKQQRAVETFENVQILVLGGARFGGKVQPYTSVVQTKGGPKRLSDVTVGDLILNPDGTEQSITAVYPHKDHKFYKVNFDDGSSTFCGMEHLWLVWASGEKKFEGLYPNSSEVLSLDKICDLLQFGYEVKIPDPLNQLTRSKTIVDVVWGFVADGCCISVSNPNRLYFTDDYIVTHNSYLGAMLTTLYADDPNARIAFFRDTLESMKRGGQIIDTVKSVYSQIEEQCRLVIGGNPPVGKIMSGPGAGDRRGQGARIEFLPMSHESDMEKIRGSSFSLAVIEEAIPNFSQDQIEFIMSCLRSNAKRESKLVMTCNPMESHFICSLIKDYYLDADGYPIDERCGDVRYFYKYLGDYYWGDSREEVYNIVTELGAFSDPDVQVLPLEDKLNRILSFSFVQLTAYDNPIGMKANPGYMAMLESMNAVQKARNLKGCWFAKEEGKGFFNREWLRGEAGQRVKSIQDIPKGCVAVRALDKAYSECSDSSPDPDYSALSPLLLKDRDGFYWVIGNYHPRLTDEKPLRKSDKPCLGRFRKLSGERDNLVSLQLKTDVDNAETFGYQKPFLALAKDSGGGSGDYYSTLARMAEDDIKVLKDQSISNVKGKKVADFSAFAAQCQLGTVYIVEDTFDQHTLNTWYKELEDFDGTPSTRTRKDDFVDATALAFNCIRSTRRPYQTLVRNQQVVETLSANLYKN